MANPSEFLYPILLDIESTVLGMTKEYSSLKDKDVEWCYSKLKNHFRERSFNKASDEPESASTAKQDLLDEILNALDSREEEKLDNHMLNTDLYTNGGKSFLNIYQVYVVCFNSLIKSVRFWRKNKSGPSYLAHINEYLS